MANTVSLWKGAVEPAEVSPSGNEIQSYKGAVEPIAISTATLTYQRVVSLTGRFDQRISLTGRT